MMQTAAQHRLHAVHAAQRRQIVLALADSASESLKKRADRLLGCCRWPSAIAMSDGKAALSLDRCRDRLCPLCSGCRAREAARRITGYVTKMDAPRFLTLTLRSTDTPLHDQINRLRDCFRRLRKRPEWRAHVAGGVYAIEVTFNRREQTWHPHVHMVIDGSFWPQASIADVWEDITEDSRIVDIRKVHSAGQVATYLAKYITKGSGDRDWPDHAIREFAEAMHGVRLLHTFGSLHGVRIDPSDRSPDVAAEDRLCSLSYVEGQAKKGDDRARRVRDLASRMGWAWSLTLGVPPQPRDERDPLNENEAAEFFTLLRRLGREHAAGGAARVAKAQAESRQQAKRRRQRYRDDARLFNDDGSASFHASKRG